MNLQAALINRGTTRMPSKEGVNSTLVSNPVPVGSTIYGYRARVRAMVSSKARTTAWKCVYVLSAWTVFDQISGDIARHECDRYRSNRS